MEEQKSNTESGRGMNTSELKAFTEMQTTLQMSTQATNKALDTINHGIQALNDRLDRMDTRWDERIRVVEASAIECREKVAGNKEDIEDLKSHSDTRDWFIGVLSVVGAFVSAMFSPK